MAATLLVASMIYHKKEREIVRVEGEGKKGERQKEKSRGLWLSHWHLWLTRSNQLISILIKLIACGAALYLPWCELWAGLRPLGASLSSLCLSKSIPNELFSFWRIDYRPLNTKNSRLRSFLGLLVATFKMHSSNAFACFCLCFRSSFWCHC